MKMDFELQQKIHRLYAKYASTLDDGPLQDWPKLFVEESLYLLIPRDNYDENLPMAIMRCESRGMLEDRVAAVQNTIMHEPRYLRHHITNIDAQLTDQGVVTATANYSVIEVVEGDLPKILSVGRYIDKIVMVDHALKFVEKKVIYDSVLVPNTIVYPI